MRPQARCNSIIAERTAGFRRFHLAPPGGEPGFELGQQLGVDARYQMYLSGSGRAVNASLLDACDRISVFLCASLPSPFEIQAQNAAGEPSTVTFETVDDTTWRVHPWPLEGERLRIQCEGRRLAASSFSSQEEFFETMTRAPMVRLVFTLLRSSAVG